jgi:C-terminal processing protease CtpA/Prc
MSQVKENSRAEKANLKLGDAIISVNGKDTSKMTLREANRYFSKIAGGDVLLQVVK